MTIHDEICALAATFAGEEEEQALRSSCAAAQTALCGRLKDGVTAEDCRDALIPAAAWLALSYLAAVRQADGVERFAVADLSVQKGTEQSGRALRMQAEALMAPYLKDNFAFLGVRG